MGSNPTEGSTRYILSASKGVVVDILEWLGEDLQSIEQLSRLTNLPTQEVRVYLARLEIDQKITHVDLDGQRYYQLTI